MLPLCGSFIISQQHGAKENVCAPRMETIIAPLCSQDVKMQQKGVSRHDLTPEILARTIRHHLVAAFYCSTNIYDNIYPTGTIYENDTHNFFEHYVFLAIGTAVAQPFSFGWPNKYQEEKIVKVVP